MATAAEFVQPIPILAYLVPLAVDVVPIKFPQSPRNRAYKNVWKNNNNNKKKKKRSKNNKSPKQIKCTIVGFLIDKQFSYIT
jgi:hypothetical protein